MKIAEIVKENASGGSTSACCIATNMTPGGTPPKGQFFGGDPASSIYSHVWLNRKKRRETNNEKNNI
jgi:hypothetical protein